MKPFRIDSRRKESLREQVLHYIQRCIIEELFESHSPLKSIMSALNLPSLPEHDEAWIEAELIREAYAYTDAKNVVFIQKKLPFSSFLIQMIPLTRSLILQGYAVHIQTHTRKTIQPHVSFVNKGFAANDSVLQLIQHYHHGDTTLAIVEAFISLNHVPIASTLFQDDESHFDALMTRYPSLIASYKRSIHVGYMPEHFSHLNRSNKSLITIVPYTMHNLQGQLVEMGTMYLTTLTQFKSEITIVK
jgi:DNA-binding GntR family transcriptional regulator